jgi:hypothetical protein
LRFHVAGNRRLALESRPAPEQLCPRGVVEPGAARVDLGEGVDDHRRRGDPRLVLGEELDALGEELLGALLLEVVVRDGGVEVVLQLDLRAGPAG